MAHVFYDHLLELEEIEELIKGHSGEPEEREELNKIVDETVHHRVLGCILQHLPREHHEDFLERFHAAPHDPTIIVFLQEKTPSDVDIEQKIKEAVKELKKELLSDLKKKKD